MKTLIITLLGTALCFGSQMQRTAGLGGDPVLTAATAEALIGGQSSPGSGGSNPGPGSTPRDSEYFAECVNGKRCNEMAEENNGIGCPSVYWQWGGNSCAPRECVYACESSATGGLCESDWWGSCTDTTLVESPGLCGDGEKGTCSYTIQFFQGLNLRKCTSSGLCYPGQGPINCGVIRTCS